MRYKPFQLLKIPQEVRDRAAVHRFSYLVFKKGASDTLFKREKNKFPCPRQLLGPEPSSSSHFPRLLNAPLQRKKSFYCRMCTSRGKLEEVLIAKKGANEDSR